MSRELVDAIRELGAEKGIDSETLMAALEDALLSAYRKSPGSARYARVDLDRDTADFRVFELILPPELEEKLLAEVAEEQEPTIDPETGEMREPEEPELDPAVLAPYEDQIKSRDVTPDDFGRIAAQTAKQVILQRVREAERQMMFDEYQDRVGELVTGIIQQSDNRYTLVQLRERVEALLPRVRAGLERALRPRHARQGGHHRRLGRGQGPVDRRLAPQPRADQGALRARGARDRRRPRRDRRRRSRARLPLEDRRDLARGRRRSRRRLRRAARLARPHGRLRASRREDRHHPPQRRARPVRRQGAFTGPRPRGHRRRRDQGGDRHRPGRSALAGDRPRGPERAPRRKADGLEGRHQVRDRLLPGGRRRHRGRGRGRRRPLRRDHVDRRAAARTRRSPARATAACRSTSRSPASAPTRSPCSSRSPTRRSRSWPTRTRTTRRSPRSWPRRKPRSATTPRSTKARSTAPRHAPTRRPRPRTRRGRRGRAPPMRSADDEPGGEEASRKHRARSLARTARRGTERGVWLRRCRGRRARRDEVPDPAGAEAAETAEDQAAEEAVDEAAEEAPSCRGSREPKRSDVPKPSDARARGART